MEQWIPCSFKHTYPGHAHYPIEKDYYYSVSSQLNDSSTLTTLHTNEGEWIILIGCQQTRESHDQVNFPSPKALPHSPFGRSLQPRLNRIIQHAESHSTDGPGKESGPTEGNPWCQRGRTRGIERRPETTVRPQPHGTRCHPRRETTSPGGLDARTAGSQTGCRS